MDMIGGRYNLFTGSYYCTWYNLHFIRFLFYCSAIIVGMFQVVSCYSQSRLHSRVNNIVAHVRFYISYYYVYLRFPLLFVG